MSFAHLRDWFVSFYSGPGTYFCGIYSPQEVRAPPHVAASPLAASQCQASEAQSCTRTGVHVWFSFLGLGAAGLPLNRGYIVLVN